MEHTYNDGQFLSVDSQLHYIKMQEVFAKVQLMEQCVEKFVKAKVESNHIFDKTLAKMKPSKERVVA